MADKTEITIEKLRIELKNIINKNAQLIDSIFCESEHLFNVHTTCKPHELSKIIRDEIPEWFDEFGEVDGGLTDDQIVMMFYEDGFDFTTPSIIDFVVRLISGQRCISNLFSTEDFLSEIELQHKISDIVANTCAIDCHNAVANAMSFNFNESKVGDLIDEAADELKAKMHALAFRGIKWKIEYSLLVWEKEWDDWDFYAGIAHRRDIFPTIKKAVLNGYTEDQLAVSVSLLVRNRVESEYTFMLNGIEC